MKKIFYRTFSYLSSLNLTIVVLAAIIVAVTINILLENYSGVDAPDLPPFIRTLRAVADVFLLENLNRSWLFKILLILFSLNLVLCCLKRIPMTLNVLRRLPVSRAADFIARFPEHAEMELNDSYPGSGECIEKKLASAFFSKPATGTCGDWSCFFWEKGRYAHAGFYLAHLGLLLVLTGMVVSGEGSAESTFFLRQGEKLCSFYIVKDDVLYKYPLKKCFRLEKLAYALEDPYEAEKSIPFTSTFAVESAGKTIKTVTVSGFNTLTYKNIRIAQLPKNENEVSRLVSLVVKPKNTGAEMPVRVVKEFDVFPVPDTGHVIRVSGVRSMGNDQAAAVLQVYDTQRRLMYRVPLSSNHAPARPRPPAAERMPWQNDYEFSIDRVETVEQARYAKFRIAVENEAVLVWYGVWTAIAGFAVMFFCSHRRIIACIERNANGHKITLSGWDSRNAGRAAVDFDKIKKQLSNH